MVTIQFPMQGTPCAWSAELDEVGDGHVIDVSGVTIERIAEGLSRMPRFGGAVGYSVAEHSVILCDWVRRLGHDVLTQAKAAVHDCTEAMGFADSHGLLKKVMCPRLRTLESQVFRAVFYKLLWTRCNPGLCAAPADIKAYDALLGNWEAVHFGFNATGALPDPDAACLPNAPECWSPAVAKIRFLHCWHKLNFGRI